MEGLQRQVAKVTFMSAILHLRGGFSAAFLLVKVIKMQGFISPLSVI